MNETLKRAISGAIYVILLLAAIEFSTESFFILFGLFMLIAVVEFCDLVEINKVIPLLVATGLFAFFYKIAVATKTESLLFQLRYSQNKDLLLLFLTLLVSVKCFFFLYDDDIQKVSPVSKYIYLIGYIILPFILITKIPYGLKGYNPKIIISIFVLIWTNDTFAYIVGKSIGKHKLFERISPKKTIEGFIGGIAFAVLASYLISKYYIEGATFIWMIIALIVGVFGTIGDLIESKFKRIAGVKDSGIIMPGHGGILDRLDSVIFVAPIVFLFYQILNYVS
ncbi:phosphatidate cytidylyltransferase [Flavobacterium restrictum]|uniref:Phosphatidate cytidylyltransferase n=1 Tax=Flavobacterium restrictum TaxID=2594428 RepID=A0A553DS37_9FLAO|nr:phosphatidate cytidylyltransferase [Flavobacterium restrictum]TRX35591.1 phosphatidate cytidylyltransferase [Flavobacterium restrictum]